MDLMVKFKQFVFAKCILAIIQSGTLTKLIFISRRVLRMNMNKLKVIVNVNGKDLGFTTSGYSENGAIRLIFAQLPYILDKKEFKNGMIVKFSSEPMEESELLDEGKGEDSTQE